VRARRARPAEGRPKFISVIRENRYRTTRGRHACAPVMGRGAACGRDARVQRRVDRNLFRSSVRTAIERREGVTPAHPGSCGAACGRDARVQRRVDRNLFRSSVRTAIERREGVTPAHPGSCGAACGRNAHAPGRFRRARNIAGREAKPTRVGLRLILIALPGGSSLPGKPTRSRASPAPGAPAAPARRGATTDSHRSACGQ
jgi:hypothetical protein